LIEALVEALCRSRARRSRAARQGVRRCDGEGRRRSFRRRRRAGHVRRSGDGPHALELLDDAGKPNADTPKIIGAIETVPQTQSEAHRAIHYYIHAVEASDDPGRAEALADTLGSLAPGRGHLVHMPAHIYIRTGRYNDATLANFRASTADKEFLAVCRGTNGMYPLGYVPHNWHFANLSAGLMGARTARHAGDGTRPRSTRTWRNWTRSTSCSTSSSCRCRPKCDSENGTRSSHARNRRRRSPIPRHLAFRTRHGAAAQGQSAEAQSELAALQKLARRSGDGKLMLGTTNYAGDLLQGRRRCAARRNRVIAGQARRGHRCAARSGEDRRHV
jgi:hypothetical protein